MQTDSTNSTDSTDSTFSRKVVPIGAALVGCCQNDGKSYAKYVNMAQNMKQCHIVVLFFVAARSLLSIGVNPIMELGINQFIKRVLENKY